MGAGDDTFVWNPGDGSDTVEGQDGLDTMLFNGANINEKIDISANGERRALYPRCGQHHHGLERGASTSTSPRWAAPTTSWSTT